MLLTFWSSKGGSGTSTVSTACAGVLAEHHAPVQLVDLAGDQPALVGAAADPTTGLNDWLALGPEAPTEALVRIAVEIDGPAFTLLPMGRPTRDGHAPPTGAAGAALAMALAEAGGVAVADLGRADTPALVAMAELADATLLVIRPCYLALRRAVQAPALKHTHGVVMIDEPGRALGAREISDVLGVPVLARVAWRSAIARAADAGLVLARTPDALRRPLTRMAGRWLDMPDIGPGAAA